MPVYKVYGVYQAYMGGIQGVLQVYMGGIEGEYGCIYDVFGCI